jgi:hypothetical protein
MMKERNDEIEWILGLWSEKLPEAILISGKYHKIIRIPDILRYS